MRRFAKARSGRCKRRGDTVTRQNGPAEPAGTSRARLNNRGSANHELVSNVLAQMQRPLTAYEILSILSPTIRMSPVSIYRALDRLIRDGRAHRVESRSAYVLCSHVHADGDPNLIAICQQCGRVEEFPLKDAVHSVRAEMRSRTFQCASMSVEVRGRCRNCVTADVDGLL